MRGVGKREKVLLDTQEFTNLDKFYCAWQDMERIMKDWITENPEYSYYIDVFIGVDKYIFLLSVENAEEN